MGEVVEVWEKLKPYGPYWEASAFKKFLILLKWPFNAVRLFLHFMSEWPIEFEDGERLSLLETWDVAWASTCPILYKLEGPLPAESGRERLRSGCYE